MDSESAEHFVSAHAPALASVIEEPGVKSHRCGAWPRFNLLAVLAVPSVNDSGVITAPRNHGFGTPVLCADGDESGSLVRASQAGRVGVLKALLARARPCAVNRRSSAGWTPLLAAARFGRGAAATQLMRAGADPACRGQHRRTPLGIAADRGHDSVVRAILATARGRATVRLETVFGLTPLMSAAAKGHVRCARAIVQACLENGDDSPVCATALERGVACGSDEMIAVLLDARSDDRVVNEAASRLTALDAARLRRAAAWASRRRLLLWRRADVTL